MNPTPTPSKDNSSGTGLTILVIVAVGIFLFGLWQTVGRSLTGDHDEGANLSAIERLVRDAELRQAELAGTTDLRQPRSQITLLPPPPDRSLEVSLEDEEEFPETEDLDMETEQEFAETLTPGQVAGWVSDRFGLPILRADVRLTFEDAEEGEKPLTLTTTSAEGGLFRFESVPPGAWLLEAERESFAKDAIAGVMVNPGQITDPIEIRLQPELVLRGVVRVGDEPVADASVEAIREHLSIRSGGATERLEVRYATSRSNEKGEFQLDRLASGRMIVRVRAAGFAPVEIPVEMASNMQPLTVAMAPEAILSGVVRNQLDQPLEGVELVLRLPGRGARTPAFATATSDRAGLFNFGQLPPSTEFQLTAKAANYSAFGPRTVMSNTTTNIVVMTTGGAISGTVVSYETDLPIAGIGVVATSENEDQRLSLWTRTNSRGQYRIERLPRGTYTVQIMNDRLTADPRAGVSVNDQRTTENINLSAYPGRNIDGVVINGATNERLEGADVTLAGRVGADFRANRGGKALTDGSGLFEFRNMPNGIYKLTAARKGYMPGIGPEAEVRVELLPGSLPQAQEIRLFEAGVIEGQVTDASGNAIKDAMIQIFHAPGTPSTIRVDQFRTKTNSTGHFVLESIPVHNEVRLFVSAFAEGHAKGRSEAFSINLQNNLQRVDLQLGRGRDVLVRVSDPGGRAIPQANLTLTHPLFSGDAAPSQWRQTSSVGGDATFRNIPDGNIRVSAGRDGFLPSSAALNLRPDVEARIEIELRPAQSMTGFVRDELRQPVTAGSVSVRPQAGATGSGNSGLSADGSFAVHTLGDGIFSVDVTAIRPTPQGERRFVWTIPDVRPNGGSGSINIQVPMNGTLTGFAGLIDRVENPPHITIAIQGVYFDSANNRRTISTNARFPANSEYQFVNLPPGDYRVTASAPNFLPVTIDGIRVTSPGSMKVPDLELRAGGVVTARVINRRTGEPLHNAVVRLVPDGPGGRTNTNGDLRISPVNPAIYTAQVTHPRSLATEVRNVLVVVGRDTHLGVIEMDPGATLFGRVTNERGENLRGIRVETRSVTRPDVKIAHTDSGGRYVVEGLIPGGQIVTFSGNLQGRPVARSVDISVSNERDSQLDMELRATATLTATLIAPAGVDSNRALANIYPLLPTGAANSGVRIQPNSRDGNQLRFNDLPYGTYVVLAQAPSPRGTLFWHGMASVTSDQATTIVSGGNNTLRGTLIAREAGPLVPNQNVQLDLLSAPQSGVNALRNWWRFNTRSDARGRFEFRDRTPGTYSIVSESDALAADILDILVLRGSEPVVDHVFNFNSRRRFPEATP